MSHADRTDGSKSKRQQSSVVKEYSDMNKRTKAYMEKAAEVIQTFPSVTKAVVIGPAVEESFAFEDNIMLAVYTEP